MKSLPRITFHGRKQQMVWKAKDMSGRNWEDHLVYLSELYLIKMAGVKNNVKN